MKTKTYECRGCHPSNTSPCTLVVEEGDDKPERCIYITDSYTSDWKLKESNIELLERLAKETSEMSQEEFDSKDSSTDYNEYLTQDDIQEIEKNDWIIFDPKNIPSNLFDPEAKFIFEYKLKLYPEDGWEPSASGTNNQEILRCALTGDYTYRYKEQLTDEGLAEEWNTEHFKHHADDCNFDTHSVKEHTSEAYLAGLYKGRNHRVSGEEAIEIIRANREKNNE